MKSFSSYIYEVMQDRSLWDYYNNTNFETESAGDIFSNSKEFIEEILRNGEKLTFFAREQFNDLAKGMRLKHTVSIYILGIAIYTNVESIRISIDDYISKIDNEMHRYSKPSSNETKTPFSYFWFLICFYHDYGYLFELQDKDKALTSLFDVLDCNINVRFPVFTVYTGVPRTILLNFQNYLNYRYKVHGKLDHGIVAGLLFWEERRREYRARRKNHSTDDFVDNGRRWSNNILMNIHMPVAITIAAHNMWFIKCDSDYVQDYKDFHLDKLITNTPKINLKNHPMLFLLSVVDTLDPIKEILRADNENLNFDCLNEVMFEFDSRSISFKININDVEFESRYRSSILNMKNWLDCFTEFNGSTYIVKF